MGTFSVQMSVSGPTGRSIEVDALVDTNSTYAVLPANVLERLKIQSVERRSFRLADERVVQHDIGEARLGLDGRALTSLVVFGPEDAAPLIGATTLGLFSRSADPVDQRLVSMPGLLKGRR